MRVGEFEILPVIDGRIVVPPTMFFPNATEQDWAPHKQFLNSDAMLEMPVGGFLVRGPGRLALVDVGMGYVERMPEFGGKLMDSLTELGHTADDITDVLYSHLHFDHIGWSSVDGRPQFPNATYRCHAKDWDHFITQGISQGPMADGLGLPETEVWLGPVADRLELWHGDGNVLPGIDVCDAPGHTPGSTVHVISSGTERAVLFGDAVHCPVELIQTEWDIVADIDPELAKRTREALAKEYEGTDTLVAAPHFPGMQFGRLLRADGRTSFAFS
jgi:glyoxylase-like metal-dependent hydrolase (beta-lactamase superfamily II)